MNRYRVIVVGFGFLLIIVGAVRSNQESKTPVPKTPPEVLKSFSGDYSIGDGMGYNLSLDLHRDGTFHCEWHGCLGKYGDADGRWGVKNNTLIFQPDNESGIFQGRDHLKKADIVDYKGHHVFVLDHYRDWYKQHGPSHFCCLHTQAAMESGLPW